MKHSTWMIPAIVCFATTVTAGQRDSNSESRDRMQTITVTGCLQPDTQNTLNTPMPAGFRLTRVMQKPGVPAVAKTYVLDGSEADLKSHVGHTVAITGRPSSKKTAATPEALKDAPPAVTAGGTNTADNGAPRLEVSAIEMIAKTCSDK